MNIALVTSEFPNTQYAATGGIGTYAQNLITGLSKSGHKVYLITNSYKDVKYIPRNITVIDAQIHTKLLEDLQKILPFGLFKRIMKVVSYPVLFQIGVLFTLMKLSRSTSIDIIEGNDFAGELFLYLLLVKKRPPVTLRLHTPSFVLQKLNNEPFNLFYRLMSFFEIYCLKKADSLYSPSNSLAKIITKKIKKPVKTVIPYPFKPVYFDLRIKRKQNLVLYVGKLQFKKGVFQLISAIPQVVDKLPDTKFIFAGPDTLNKGYSVKKLLISNIRRNKLLNNVIFYSDLNKKKLLKLYIQSTIVIIPSIWENFPNVCLEAMANGSLVIANKVGGIGEIIKNNLNGILTNTTIPELLAKEIIEHMINFKKRNSLTSKARKFVKTTYNIKFITKLTVKYYLNCMHIRKLEI